MSDQSNAILGDLTHYMTSTNYIQTVMGSGTSGTIAAAPKERNFEFCPAGEKVDWAKFCMWLRGFLSAIEGQPLTPDSVAKIMEKLAYVDPEAQQSYGRDPKDDFIDMLQKQLEYERLKKAPQWPQPNPHVRPLTADPRWVYNPTTVTYTTDTTDTTDTKPDRPDFANLLLNNLQINNANTSKQSAFANSAAAAV